MRIDTRSLADGKQGGEQGGGSGAFSGFGKSFSDASQLGVSKAAPGGAINGKSVEDRAHARDSGPEPSKDGPGARSYVTTSSSGHPSRDAGASA